jgi:hypothetical protein
VPTISDNLSIVAPIRNAEAPKVSNNLKSLVIKRLDTARVSALEAAEIDSLYEPSMAGDLVKTNTPKTQDSLKTNHTTTDSTTLLSNQVDSSKIQSQVAAKSESTFTPVLGIQFRNDRNKRQLIIREGQHVKVFVRNRKNRLKYKKAVLTSITDNLVTFKPKNKNLKEITYCVDCGIYQDVPPLEKISFITGGSITRFIIFHGGILFLFYEIAANPVVAAVALITTVVSRPILEIASYTSKAKKVPYPGSIRTHINSNPNKPWVIHVIRLDSLKKN